MLVEVMDARLFEIIQIIRHCPTTYLGPIGSPYSGLVGFISGYVQGAHWARLEQAKSAEAFPQSFNEFVKSALNGKYGHEKFGRDDHWIDVIRQEGGSQEGAFELFYDFFDQFNRESSGT